MRPASETARTHERNDGEIHIATDAHHPAAIDVGEHPTALLDPDDAAVRAHRAVLCFVRPGLERNRVASSTRVWSSGWTVREIRSS
jgi:hypothetical protein